jgi:hypothetical protein
VLGSGQLHVIGKVIGMAIGTEGSSFYCNHFNNSFMMRNNCKDYGDVI